MTSLGSLTGLIVAHTVLAVPYVVLVLSIALNSFDRRIEQVAFTLGASWPSVFLRIIAPNLAPSLVAAWIFAFIVSFDEITMTIFLAGTYETVPKRMFTQLLERVDPTISAIATLLIAGSVVIVAVLTLLMQRPDCSSAANDECDSSQEMTVDEERPRLDWLISSATTNVLFCSKVTRDRHRSSIWARGISIGLPTTTMVPHSSPPSP